MASGKVHCEKCENSVTPRLWHNEGDLLTNRLIEHICPICGVTMYSTGGGFTGISKAFAIYLVIPFAFIVIFFNDTKWRQIDSYIYFYWVVVSCLILYSKSKSKASHD